MTTVDVDAKVYYQAATNCFDAADALWDSFRYVFTELSNCGRMAGIDEDGRTWAASYDKSATEAVAFFEATHDALYAYGVALNDLGFSHAQSDAKLQGTTQPERPKDRDGNTFGPYHIPATAGGSGIGLAKAAVEVLDAINCPLPDGDTDKLAKAAEAWDRLGTIYQNTNAKDKITISGTLFANVVSDDVQQVRDDLKTLENSMGELLSICKQISKACTDYKESIQALRENIKEFIEGIVEDAALDIAITIIATALTGVGGLIAGAKAVESARRWAGKIQTAVKLWRSAKWLQIKGVADDAVANMAKAKKAVTDLRDRLRKSDTEPNRPPALPTKPALTDIDKKALWEYTGPVAEELNWKIRNGALSKVDDLRISDINAALDKLPDYTGTVTRRVNLDAEYLARYEPGSVVTETAFTSTARSPTAAFEGNVEMQIISKHGKSVEEFARKPEEQEVLFKSGTSFEVVNKFPDPNNPGRIIVQMIEV
ncbi:ADP-ribosyltransferase [Nocardia sp. NPDC127579]|uniref:WXG100-like domain-containing protein n=1 Tax=Nocardia sp. NPDC127579 TaxID=3345402 RepID=UPI0036282969